MLSLFSFLSASTFIPYAMSQKITLTAIEYDEALNMSKDYSIVLGLALNKNSNDYVTLFSQLEGLYNESVKFVLIKKQSLRQKLGKSTPAFPVLVTMKKGKQVHAIGNVNSYDYLEYTVENYLNPHFEVVDGNSNLISRFGQSHMTIFTSSKNMKKCQSIWTYLINHFGPVNIEYITDRTAKEIGINPMDFGYFRTVDKVLDVIKESQFADKKTESQKVDYLKRELLKVVKSPTYERFTMRDLKKTKKPVCVIMTKKPNEKMLGLLHELGKLIKSFAFGYIDEKDYDDVYDWLGYTNQSLVNISVFSIAGMYSYPVDTFFEKIGTHEFVDAKWAQPLADFLMDIAGGKIAPVYKSEMVTDDVSILKKLNSTTYTSFINQNEDVIIQYVRRSCRECGRGFKFYKDFIEFITNSNVSMKFGFIDVSRNGVKGGFPTRFRDPQFVLYPKGKKVDPIPLLNVYDVPSLMSAIAMFSSDHSFMNGPKKMGEKEFKELEERVKYVLTKLPYHDESILKKAMKTITDFQKKPSVKKEQKEKIDVNQDL